MAIDAAAAAALTARLEAERDAIASRIAAVMRPFVSLSEALRRAGAAG